MFDEEEEDISVSCSVKVLFMDKQGCTKKTVADQKTLLSLHRNEFRDIFLKIQSQKISLQYEMKDMNLHTRFVKEGKATIKLAHLGIQVLVSNCPPNKLAKLLKTLIAKTERAKTEKTVGAKQRLLSQKPRSFEEISPLSEVDINVLKNARKGSKQTMQSSNGTPKSSKRKIDDDKENEGISQKKMTVQRPLCSSTVLTFQQRQVMSAVMSGRNVFFTGSAGTGKSFLLKRILGALAPESTFATASTGVAACQIGGITLHAFAGIGLATASLKLCLERLQQKGKGAQWKKCKHLIVDEISMVDGQIFKKLENIARIVRNNNKPFGGIQLILSGDFFQLPPVCKTGETRSFCFQTSAWRRCIDVNIELTHVKRQKDPEFINILQAVRKGQCSEEAFEKLKSTLQHHIDKDGIIATRLSTHKDDVNFINESRLKMLSGESRVFHASDSDVALSSHMNDYFPVKDTLELKIGAQVMLTKNLDVLKGLVNGARGVVVGFETGKQGLPTVKFVSGNKETIGYEKWTVRTASSLVLVRKMLPLKLAWAMSIHKSQGMTLDCVEVSLLRVFECGQAYVALSRAKSLQGLRILDIEQRNIRADPEVLKFYAELQNTTLLHQSEIDDYL